MIKLVEQKKCVLKFWVHENACIRKIIWEYLLKNDSQDTGLKNQSFQGRIESDIDMIRVLNHERQMPLKLNKKKYCRKSLGFSDFIIVRDGE